MNVRKNSIMKQYNIFRTGSAMFSIGIVLDNLNDINTISIRVSEKYRTI